MTDPDFRHGSSFNRRSFLQAAAVVGVVGGGSLVTTQGMANTADPVCETRFGKVRGVTGDGCHRFLGIRYATAQRFMPPVPPKPWSGVQDAVSFGASAPQTNSNPPPGPPYVITAQIPNPSGKPPPPRLPESEDCLFLNVWTPSVERGRKLPVMVWLHGGFFYAGSGSTVDGSGIAARGDAVVVSINHRLNAFGFTRLADIAGSEFAHSGNAGMLDIVAALEWVRDNIEAFGGDPGRVMVFGSSGGGMKTSFLMASPRAKGLLHRAGVQSGPGLRFMERDAASNVTDRLLSELGLQRSQAADLALVPQERLLAAYHAVAAALPAARFIDLPSFAPVIDPELLPVHPFSPSAAVGAEAIPMLIGWNAQEMSFFWGNDPEAFTLDEAGLQARAATYLGEAARTVIAHYRAAFPQGTPAQLHLQMFSDYSLMLPVLAQADRHAAAGSAGTFCYRLDYGSPALGGKLGALHTMETPLVFDRVEASRGLLGAGQGPQDIASVMSGAWARFAAAGDPNGAGLPEWPRYTTAERRIMLFDEQPNVAADPAGAARAAMAGLLQS